MVTGSKGIMYVCMFADCRQNGWT